MTEETIVKGIILSSAPQGEYGLRLSVLTDRLGKITVFAGGARKQGSKLMGLTRPLTAAEFSLIRGRSAWTLSGAKLMDSFGELTAEYDSSVRAGYVLELGDYFSMEGAGEEESKELLNLMYLTLDALRRAVLPPKLVLSILRLRMLVAAGEYTEEPADPVEAAAAWLWRHTVSCPLSMLYRGLPEALPEWMSFRENVEYLFRRQVPRHFHAERLTDLV